MKNTLKYILPVLVIGLLCCKEANKKIGTEQKTNSVRTDQDSTITNPNAGESFNRSAGDAVTNTGGSTGAAVKARPGRQ